MSSLPPSPFFAPANKHSRCMKIFWGMVGRFYSLPTEVRERIVRFSHLQELRSALFSREVTVALVRLVDKLLEWEASLFVVGDTFAILKTVSRFLLFPSSRRPPLPPSDPFLPFKDFFRLSYALDLSLRDSNRRGIERALKKCAVNS